jgi:flagellar capping protein FliD
VLAANPGAVQSFFQNAAGTGFASNFNNDLVHLTDPTEGVISLDIAGNKAQQNALTKQITSLQDRLAAENATLTSQYNRLNATLEAYPSLLLTVTAEIGALAGNYNATPNTQTNTTPAIGTPTG